MINVKRSCLYISENTIKNIKYCKKISKPRVLMEIKNAVKDDKIRSNFKDILLLVLKIWISIIM